MPKIDFENMIFPDFPQNSKMFIGKLIYKNSKNLLNKKYIDFFEKIYSNVFI